MRIKNDVSAGRPFLFLHALGLKNRSKTRRYATGGGEIRKIVEKRVNEFDRIVLKHTFVAGDGLTEFFQLWKIDMTSSIVFKYNIYDWWFYKAIDGSPSSS